MAIDMDKKLTDADAALAEIAQEIGPDFHPNGKHPDGFLMDRVMLLVITAFVEVEATASLDLGRETPSKALICERLLEAHEQIVDLVQGRIEKLREIKDQPRT